MTSVTDLLNPTFLMFLGILVLAVALIVVYFESKMREQNHKIASMLSLVSTLAEDMNGLKMGVNQFAIRGGHNSNISIKDNLGISDTNNLIEVSDDDEEVEDEEDTDEEETDEEERDEEDTDQEETDNENEEHSDDEDEQSEDEVKVIKLQVSNEEVEDIHSYEEADNLEFDQNDDLDEFNINDDIPEIAEDYVEEILDLKYDEKPEEIKNSLEELTIPSTSDLKTISINLGDDSHDTIDYKKLQLPKLRNIAVEKGLASNSDASKLKKQDLLKLLGAE
jgi:NADH:ubiquinone oxidoreductase subunit K